MSEDPTPVPAPEGIDGAEPRPAWVNPAPDSEALRAKAAVKVEPVDPETVAAVAGAASAPRLGAGEVNVVPSIVGAVVPERGKPIPSTESRTVEWLDERPAPVAGNAQYQAPDPLVTASNAWDGVRETASGKTLPPGTTEQPGAPAGPPVDPATILTHEMGRALRPAANFTPGSRTLAPRPYLASAPDPRVVAAPAPVSRPVFPQQAVATPSRSAEALHAEIAAKAAQNVAAEPVPGTQSATTAGS